MEILHYCLYCLWLWIVVCSLSLDTYGLFTFTRKWDFFVTTQKDMKNFAQDTNLRQYQQWYNLAVFGKFLIEVALLYFTIASPLNLFFLTWLLVIRVYGAYLRICLCRQA